MIKLTRFWLAVACFAISPAVHELVGQTEYPNLERFEDDEIVPDVLPYKPTEIAYVLYSGGHSVYLGNVLAPSQVRRAPYVKYTADPTKYHTLIMVDPDAPSRTNPFYKEWLHWLVVNIPGYHVSEGETLASYVPPNPHKDTGLHRYVFVVYEQPSGSAGTFKEPRLGPKHNRASDRANFSVQSFASYYHLGDPLAGNYFLSKWVQGDVSTD